MKYLPVHIIIIAFLLLTACSNDPVADTTVKNEIKFRTGVISTRGIINSDANDIPQQPMTGIQVIRGTDGDTQEGFATASVASSASIAAKSGTMVLSTSQYFNNLKSKAHFMAFYPEPGGFVPGKASWTIDGTQDIMVTEPVTADYQGSRSVAFTFNHCLAQVILKLVAKDNQVAGLYGDLLSAKINVPSELEMTFENNGDAALSKKGNSLKTDIDFGRLEMKTDTATSKGLLIYPDAADLTEITLAFENRQEAILPINSLLELKPGYKTTIVATVTGVAINFKVTLEPWKSASEYAGQDDEVGLDNPGESLK